MSLSSMKYSKYLLSLMMVITLSACVTSPLQQPVATTPVVSPEVMQKYQSALRLMKLGKHEAALKVFAAVSLMDDRLSGPYVNSGLIYLQQDKKDAASTAFRQAIERKPDNATALTQLAVLQREDFQLEVARGNYQKAVDAEPDHGHAHLNLGILCDIYLRDYACARDHYEAYLHINGEDADVKNWLIDLRERM